MPHTVIGAAWVARSAAEIEALAHSVPLHMRPILSAVAQRGIAFGVLVPGGRVPRQAPRHRWTLTIIGADLEQSHGPERFHRKSLCQILERATHVCVNAADAEVGNYQLFTDHAVAGGHVVVIETRPEHESAWLRVALRYAPKAATVILSPNAARLAHAPGRA
ncbi:MAG TPA: hypothetical protein VD995_16010 [Azospirillum sp.]|nr:hypothetical protein [Azospirillum sp.]